VRLFIIYVTMFLRFNIDFKPLSIFNNRIKPVIIKEYYVEMNIRRFSYTGIKLFINVIKAKIL